LSAQAQNARVTGEVKDGYYEITLKTTDNQKIILDELARDRDLDPKSLYRVTTGGYLSFNEEDWVRKVEFKVFDIPVSAMPKYGDYSKILTDINTQIWNIKRVLSSYDALAFRLMNICDKSQFDSLREIDQNIVQQLAVYRRLILLRSLVTNALSRFVRDRTCVDRFEKYKADLDIWSRRLTELSKDYERLRRKAIRASEQPTVTPAELRQQTMKKRLELEQREKTTVSR
jgi:hypothetical protein